MFEPNPFTAQLLRASADGLAGIAASRLLEANQEILDRHSPDAFEVWRMHMRVQISALAAAIADGLPEGFSRQASWSREAFETRDVPISDLQTSLATLQSVLEEELPPAASNSLGRFFDKALLDVEDSKVVLTKELQPDTKNNHLALKYLEALLLGDATRAWSLVDQAIINGMDPKVIMFEILPAVQIEVGRLWHRNELSVGEEHFVTQTTRRVSGRVLDRAAHAAPNGKCVVVGAVAGDAHDLAAQLVADAFEMDGWRVVCLGADIPASEMALSAIRFEADLVAISATLDIQREAVEETVAALRKIPSSPPVLVGGSAFTLDDSLWKRSGADGHANNASDAILEAHRLLNF